MLPAGPGGWDRRAHPLHSPSPQPSYWARLRSSYSLLGVCELAQLGDPLGLSRLRDPQSPRAGLSRFCDPQGLLSLFHAWQWVALVTQVNNTAINSLSARGMPGRWVGHKHTQTEHASRGGEGGCIGVEGQTGAHVCVPTDAVKYPSAQQEAGSPSPRKLVPVLTRLLRSALQGLAGPAL